MIDFDYWKGRVRLHDKPWLVLGKGPSIDRLPKVDLVEYNILTLNHAIKAVAWDVDIAHFIDVEAFEDCATDVAAKANWLLMPTRPHVKMTLGPPLESYLRSNPVAIAMHDDDRLVGYTKEPRSPVYKSPGSIAVRYFSFEAALGILGEMGVRKVFTLGIDGGTSYGTAFIGLRPLENGRSSFDIQFEAAREICEHYKMTYEALK